MQTQTAPSATDTSVSERLSVWIAGLSPADIPANVRRAVADTVLDTVGLSIASLGTDYGVAVRKAAPEAGVCTVFGSGLAQDAFSAALINGTTGHGEDYDNTYEGCPVHTGVVIVPALTAAGEIWRLSADRVAMGMAVGIEVMCRLGALADKSVHSAGFHPTSVLGAVSAAAGISAALGHNARQIRDAMAIAASMSSGIIEYLADGSWTKRMHPGWAAQSGLRAAAMGGAGFAGPVSMFEGKHGLFAAFAPSLRPDFDILLSDLGQRWEAARVAFKPYACGTMTQPYIDCAARLSEQGVALDQIDQIICRVGEGTVHRLWEPLTLKQNPPTAYAAKFSGPYCVAAGLLFRDAGLAQFTEQTIRDPQILALAGKVTFQVDPANEYPANYTGHVAIRMKDGRELSQDQLQMRGGARQPLTRADLLRKCAANLVFGGWNAQVADDLAQFADDMPLQTARFSAAAFGARRA